MADEKRPIRRRRWIGLLMSNGNLHIKQYYGPWTFQRSIAYEKYSTSRYIQRVIGYLEPRLLGASIRQDHLRAGAPARQQAVQRGHDEERQHRGADHAAEDRPRQRGVGTSYREGE